MWGCRRCRWCRYGNPRRGVGADAGNGFCHGFGPVAEVSECVDCEVEVVTVLPALTVVRAIFPLGALDDLYIGLGGSDCIGEDIWSKTGSGYAFGRAVAPLGQRRAGLLIACCTGGRCGHGWLG